MLKDSLYTIIATDHQDDVIHAVLELDADNEIFQGHFPDQPVLPGACMLQLVKEVLESTINTPVRLQKADNLKFLSLIDPRENNLLHLEINYTVEDAQIKVTANLSSLDVVCFKLQGVFVEG